MVIHGSFVFALICFLNNHITVGELLFFSLSSPSSSLTQLSSAQHKHTHIAVQVATSEAVSFGFSVHKNTHTCACRVIIVIIASVCPVAIGDHWEVYKREIYTSEKLGNRLSVLAMSQRARHSLPVASRKLTAHWNKWI